MSKLSKIIGLFVLAIMLLTACGPQPAPPATAATQPPTAKTPTQAATQAPVTGAATAGTIDCMGAKSGDTISMLYQWSGVEASNLNTVLQPLVDVCGIVLKSESTSDQALLGTRVKAGTPPDIAFWNVAQFVQYQDQLKTMDFLGAHRENYTDFFINPGTVNGKWLGLPVQVDVKTIIWYSPTNFKALGYKVPSTWDELNALADKMAADGNVPWSMGFESGDTTGSVGSDFIQDILLVQQGPQYILDIISGKVPYNDRGVKQAYETYGKWAMDPTYTVGGAKGTASTSSLDAIYKPFMNPPQAMMVRQAGFAGSEIAKQFPALKQGTDYNFFVIPGAQGLQGNATWLIAFSDKPAVKAMVAYLSSTLGGKNWARATFGLSPNKSASGNYIDPALQKLDQALSTAKGFTPDMDDAIPGGFAGAEWKAIVDYVNGGNLDKDLSDVAAAQAAALKP